MKKVWFKLAPFGFFVLDERGEIVEFERFPKDPEKAARFFHQKNLLEEFLSKLKKKYKVRGEAEVEIGDLALKAEVFKERKEFIEFMNRFGIGLTRLRIKEAYSKDVLIIHAIHGIDELDRMINVLYERASELFGLYYPEAVEKLESIERFIKVAKDPLRKEVSKKLRISEESMGYELEEKDLELLRGFVLRIEELLRFRKELVSYINSLMLSFAPSLANLAGGLLGARLIALASGLENLARLPSSTIQVLGAEKALFRHLRKKAKPPKHGVLLQHPLVLGARKEDRGKVARSLASKIAIAAKVDFYSKKEVGTKLLVKLKRLRR